MNVVELCFDGIYFEKQADQLSPSDEWTFLEWTSMIPMESELNRISNFLEIMDKHVERFFQYISGEVCEKLRFQRKRRPTFETHIEMFLSASDRNLGNFVKFHRDRVDKNGDARRTGIVEARKNVEINPFIVLPRAVFIAVLQLFGHS